MIERLVQQELINRLKVNPAVGLVGPRQCGKTTLAKALGGAYFDLEQESERLRLDLQWSGLTAAPELVVLDEAQTWPDVFQRLRAAIDSDRKHNGRFLLLGSISPALMVHVSESLAGRLSILELTPLLSQELPDQRLNDLWLRGGFPDGGILAPARFPQWQADYLALLIQRDLPSWGLPARPQTTERLLRMVAALHGQSWNASQVGQSLGLDQKTINTYMDYLVGAFLLRRLMPFHANIKKRLVKSPKIFWRDTGLLHSVLNVSSMDTLLQQPWVGASWEGFVISQIIGVLTARGRRFEPYYFRTSDQQELDLVLDWGTQRWAFEIKLSASPGTADMDRLNRTADLFGAERRFLVSQTSAAAGDAERFSGNLHAVIDQLLAHSAQWA